MPRNSLFILTLAAVLFLAFRPSYSAEKAQHPPVPEEKRQFAGKQWRGALKELSVSGTLQPENEKKVKEAAQQIVNSRLLVYNNRKKYGEYYSPEEVRQFIRLGIDLLHYTVENREDFEEFPRFVVNAATCLLHYTREYWTLDDLIEIRRSIDNALEAGEPVGHFSLSLLTPGGAGVRQSLLTALYPREPDVRNVQASLESGNHEHLDLAMQWLRDPDRNRELLEPLAPLVMKTVLDGAAVELPLPQVLLTPSAQAFLLQEITRLTPETLATRGARIRKMLLNQRQTVSSNPEVARVISALDATLVASAARLPQDTATQLASLRALLERWKSLQNTDRKGAFDPILKEFEKYDPDLIRSCEDCRLKLAGLLLDPEGKRRRDVVTAGMTAAQTIVGLWPRSPEAILALAYAYNSPNQVRVIAATELLQKVPVLEIEGDLAKHYRNELRKRVAAVATSKRQGTSERGKKVLAQLGPEESVPTSCATPLRFAAARKPTPRKKPPTEN